VSKGLWTWARVMHLIAASSVVAGAIVLERLFALRRSAVAPSALVEALDASFGPRSLDALGLRRNLPLLAAVANVATLLGLLGTVFGMLEAFDQIAVLGVSELAPAAGAASAEASPPRNVVVVLREDGGLFVDDRPADLAGLSAHLDAAGTGAALELRADQRVPHGRVVEVLDLARARGIHELGIAVVAGPQGGATSSRNAPMRSK